VTGFLAFYSLLVAYSLAKQLMAILLRESEENSLLLDDGLCANPLYQSGDSSRRP
jgi:hypothetical protein